MDELSQSTWNYWYDYLPMPQSELIYVSLTLWKLDFERSKSYHKFTDGWLW